VPNKNALSTVPLFKVKNGVASQLATAQEKNAEYDNIARQKRGYKASWYKQHAALLITDPDVDTLRDKSINSFYTELTNIYKKSKGYPSDFDGLPSQVQMALFDMIFNVGANKIVHSFIEFDKNMKAGDWNKAAANSYRPQVSAVRNRYVQQLLSAAAAQTVK
jgi:hypothetical protein